MRFALVDPATARGIAAQIADGGLGFERQPTCGACRRCVPMTLLRNPGHLLASPDWCGWCARALSATAREKEATAARPLVTLSTYADRARPQPKRDLLVHHDAPAQRAAQRQARTALALWERAETLARRVAVAGAGWGSRS